MARKSTLPYRLQPMLATLTDSPFDDPNWVFEDKFDGFRMVAEIRRGRVALYSRNGKIISRSYVEVAKALEDVKADAVIDGELVAIGKGRCIPFPVASKRPSPQGQAFVLRVRPYVRRRRGPARAAAPRAQAAA